MSGLKKTVCMVGMMGAGKTAIGTAVARMLGVPFLDSDAEIERAANATIPELFAEYGEAFFRQKESQVLSRLLVGTPCILSTGGGAYLAQANRTAITERGVALWIKADPALLWTRVRHKDTRPLLRTANPRATLEALIAERDPIYALADLRVEAAEGLSVEAMAERTIEVIATRPDVLKRKDA
ncbi:Shikimate kinase 1 [Rhodobacteraceae bacterium THAF1]|uniref:shikimate kinase n=1 Tax=Palleronia sp. THAF1 TaxID=2587842 RepID=UPI000F3BC31D|nr:shikimate kinase [Palleronia sp. THAF1]QFU08481.1 Shikimate kinase 1 [Palleronia sp. THAF1]VDC29421.1 Shikimate kinase 1 [Rhodobacteraceae bacterium THAF1]